MYTLAHTNFVCKKYALPRITNFSYKIEIKKARTPKLVNFLLYTQNFMLNSKIIFIKSETHSKRTLNALSKHFFKKIIQKQTNFGPYTQNFMLNSKKSLKIDETHFKRTLKALVAKKKTFYSTYVPSSPSLMCNLA